MALGLAADAKLNIMPPEHPFAIAPRLRVGGADVPESFEMQWDSASKGSAWLAEAGLVASYRLALGMEPYLGVCFGNYWIKQYPRDISSRLEPNQRYTGAEGYGDGMLKLALGFDLTAGETVGVLAEYGFWKTAQNDPGNGFAFVDNHLFTVAARF